MCADLYFYIRTWLCVSCGYKKKNTWQRARAARQVQSFHSKHICVCWASVALGRQRTLACRASDYWALGESALTAAGLQSTARSHGGGNRGGYETCRHPSQPFSTLTVCVKSKCSSSLEIGFWKHPGDSAIAKLILGGFLVCWIFFLLFACFLGFITWRVPPQDGSAHILTLTLAETSALLCRAVLSQHQCWGNPCEHFLVGPTVIYWQSCNLGLAPVMSF